MRQVEYLRKTAVIDAELSRLNVNIAALQETRLGESGTLQEQDCIFFWQGKAAVGTRLHGVGFVVRNCHLLTIQLPIDVTERILTLTLSTPMGFAGIMGVYGPTLSATLEVKDQFYEDLDATIDRVPRSEPLFLLWDFNARVGKDHDSWCDRIMHFGVSKINETETTGTLHLPQALHQQHVLQYKPTPSGFQDTLKVRPLASAGLNPPQECLAKECTHHTQLPQRRL